jgi:hypothetical protein
MVFHDYLRDAEVSLTENYGIVNRNRELRLNAVPMHGGNVCADLQSLGCHRCINAFPQVQDIGVAIHLLKQAERGPDRKMQVRVQTLISEHRGCAEECHYERLVFSVAFDDCTERGVVLVWIAESDPTGISTEAFGESLDYGEVWFGPASFVPADGGLRDSSLSG